MEGGKVWFGQIPAREWKGKREEKGGKRRRTVGAAAVKDSLSLPGGWGGVSSTGWQCSCV